MSDFHIVSSISAAGCLRYAVSERRLSGKVFSIEYPLNLGPLSDGYQRMAFFQELCDGYPPSPPLDDPAFDYTTSHDVFAPWQTIRNQLQKHAPDRLLLWTSGSGEDCVFLRMACHRLGDTGVTLYRVPVPPCPDGMHAVAAHPPEILAPLVAGAVALAATECRVLAREFETIAAHPAPLREVDASGCLLFKEISAHDDLLIDACSTEWREALRVVGDAMGRCDPRNPLWDQFLMSRLKYLIDSGGIDARDDGYRVRLR